MEVNILRTVIDKIDGKPKDIQHVLFLPDITFLSRSKKSFSDVVYLEKFEDYLVCSDVEVIYSKIIPSIPGKGGKQNGGS